jgi:hypothetical protein
LIIKVFAYGLMTALWFLVWGKLFLFTTILDCSKLPILLRDLPGNTAADHSPQINAEIKNVWNFTCTPTQVFTAWGLNMMTILSLKLQTQVLLCLCPVKQMTFTIADITQNLSWLFMAWYREFLTLLTDSWLYTSRQLVRCLPLGAQYCFVASSAVHVWEFVYDLSTISSIYQLH